MANALYISPTPAAAHPLRLKAIVRPAGLSMAFPETWLSRHMGDVLLQAALIEAWQFLKNEGKMNEAATMYASLLPTAKAEVSKLSRRTYAGIGMAPPATGGEG